MIGLLYKEGCVYVHETPTSLPRLLLRTPRDFALRALFLAMATWPIVLFVVVVRSFLF